MVNSNTRGILLAQMRKRKELVKLSETFEKLQQIYFEVAFESMSEDEAKLYDLVVDGNLYLSQIQLPRLLILHFWN